MSTIEKLFVQIFERKKCIIDQAKQQINFFDQHLASKLLIDGIVPPPWLRNPMLHSVTSDPKELNREELISEVLFPQSQSGIPFSSSHCSLRRLVLTTDNDHYPNGSHAEVHALNKDCDAGNEISLLPECSVNDGGCASNGDSHMDSWAISPQNQIEASDSYHDPNLSLARMQRSKSRQRALELRNSAKAAKSCSQRYRSVDGLEIIKSFHSNIDSCAMEDLKIGDYLTKTNDNSNYSAKITRSRSSAKKLNSLNVANSSYMATEGDKSNSADIQLEPVNPYFTNESFGVREESIGDYQWKDNRGSFCHQRLTRSRSSSRQAKCSDELLKLDRPLNRGKELGVMQSADHHVELTKLGNTSDIIDGSCGEKGKLGASWKNKDENNISDRIKVPRDSSPPSDNHIDFSKLGGSSNILRDDSPTLAESIGKLTDSHQLSSLKDAKGSEMPVLRSSLSQKDSGLCGVKSRGHSSGRSYAEEHSIQEHSHLLPEISKSASSNIWRQRVTGSRSTASNNSQNAQGTELFAGRSSSSQNDSKLSTTMDAVDCAHMDNENVEYAPDTGDEITCKTEGLSRPFSFYYSDSKVTGLSDSASNKPPLVKSSIRSEAIGPVKVSNTQDNVLTSARTSANAQMDRSAAATAQTDSDCGGLVEHTCSGFKLAGSGLKIGLEVLVSRPPSDCVMIVKPKQLDFDDLEERSLNRISGHALEEETQDKLTEKLNQENLLGKVTSIACQGKCNYSLEAPSVEQQEVLIRGDAPQTGYSDGHVKETDERNEPLKVNSSIKEMPEFQKDLRTHENEEMPREEVSLVHLPTLEVACNILPQSSPKAVVSNVSDVHADTRINLSLEKVIEDSEAVKPSELHLEDSKLGGDVGSTKMLTVAGFAEVTGTAQAANLDETVRDLTVEFCNVVADELKVGLKHHASNLGISLYQNSECSAEKWVSGGKNACCSTEHQSAEISMLRSFTSDLEHSCPQHKRRKTDSQPATAMAASTSLLEKPLESNNLISVSTNLNMTEGNQTTPQEDQHFSYHQEKYVEQLNKSDGPLEDIELTEEYHMAERFSPKVETDEGKHIFEGRHGSANTSFTFTLNELGASLVSSLTEQGQVEAPSKCTTEQNLVSSHFTNTCGLESEECVNCFERIMQERRSNLGGNFSYSSPGSLDSQSLDRIEYSTILEQHHNSASIYSPSSCSSMANRLHKMSHVFQSVPNGLLEGLNLRSSLLVKDDSRRLHSDGLPIFNNQSPWDTGNPHTSPIQTLWDRITSNFGSSGKRRSLNPELPCISEENENVDEVDDTFQKGFGSEVMTSPVSSEPLADVTVNTNPPVSVSQVDIFAGRCSIESVNIELSLTGTRNRVKQNQNGSRRKCTNTGKESQGISLGANGAERISQSLRNRVSKPKLSVKSSVRKEGPTLSGRMPTRTNIVSNISSFIPLVQQKQAAAVLTGKRDIKVKALETAEAAKRLAEKKDNERKMKKEAIRLQRERSEQETLRQLELQKKKKEEERKQKEAEMATRKRRREEEERKEKERKRKRVDEARKQQLEQVKSCAKREDKEKKLPGVRVQESKESKEEKKMHQKLEKEERSDFLRKVLEIEPVTTRVPENDEIKASLDLEDSKAVSDNGNLEMVTSNLVEVTEDDKLIDHILQEQSYDISPYKGSDDEDEDEDDIPNSKFIPSWASKHCLSQAVSSQKFADPETIFPPQSFCDIAEVLLPRKLQIK
ncbi:Inner centromere protein, ARK-binding domain containing protein [Quillaja saponaria]|uniref:Inner centromere protein, ARK-binding domain containing protein n=1 Tax=Quillaja saponaria TaxID=32244 RepID=A0AAD7M619_QUISA|nr:Inner centromere protein, ARK-binding domain containing protein [Quillaja saponaria]KAJ7970599.1 Inner centromere protein, ARK-binding domain containing protein [Quillaja saponaria]